MEVKMPGDARINIRASQEDVEAVKKAALAMRKSLTTFLLEPALHIAQQVNSGEVQLVVTSPAAQKEPAKVQPGPSRVQGVAARADLGQVTPDTPIGEIPLDEIKRWVRVEEEYARMQNDQDY
jgi:uncharacterized protein (DUF1778 family)